MKRMLALAALLLALSFGSVVWVEVRQIQAVQTYLPVGVDNVLWAYGQLNFEAYKLNRALMSCLTGSSEQRDQLSLRYEVLVSRYRLVLESPLSRAFWEGGGFSGTIGRFGDFVATVDREAPSSGSAWPPERVRRVAALLDPLLPELGRLFLAANLSSTEAEDQRNQAVTRIANESLILALVQLALVVAFAGLLYRQLRVAQAASQAKGQFLANMSHEIRTPLNGVLGPLDLALEATDPARRDELIRTAQISARHLMVLLNDVLDLSKLESGRLVLEQAEIDLNLLLTDLEAVFRVDATARGLAFRVVREPGLPAWQRGDPLRLRQVLLNLLSNALKFTEKGSVVLTCGGDERTLRFQVRDTGIGMSEETVKALFRRFGQADPSVTRRFGGTGLGLEISRTLVRLMGGRLDVSSAAGQGSTFTVSLPRSEAPAEPAPAVLESRTGGVPAPAAPTLSGRALRVLAVDDGEINLLVIKSLLKTLGHTCVTVASGPLALQTLQGDPDGFDVILMDLHMPEWSGLETTRRLREQEAPGSRVFIVALTADVLTDSREACLEAGMDDFLTKPIQKKALEDLLRRRLQPPA